MARAATGPTTTPRAATGPPTTRRAATGPTTTPGRTPVPAPSGGTDPHHAGTGGGRRDSPPGGLRTGRVTGGSPGPAAGQRGYDGEGHRPFRPCLRPGGARRASGHGPAGGPPGRVEPVPAQASGQPGDEREPQCPAQPQPGEDRAQETPGDAPPGRLPRLAEQDHGCAFPGPEAAAAQVTHAPPEVLASVISRTGVRSRGIPLASNSSQAPSLPEYVPVSAVKHVSGHCTGSDR